MKRKYNLSIIVAMGRDRVIGAGDQLPWNLPADMKHFMELTMGHPIIMGRKTHESIGVVLPGRTNIILTRDENFEASGCLVAHSIEEALEYACGGELELAVNQDITENGIPGEEVTRGKDERYNEIFVIGGADIYRQFLSLANEIYLTLIDHDFQGDIHFPVIDWSCWKEVHREQGIRDIENPFEFQFIHYKKKD